MTNLLVMMLSSCGISSQITKTEYKEVPVPQIIPIPENLTEPVMKPKKQKFTCRSTIDILVPTLFSKLDQCNKQLLEIKNLKVDDENDG